MSSATPSIPPATEIYELQLLKSTVGLLIFITSIYFWTERVQHSKKENWQSALCLLENRSHCCYFAWVWFLNLFLTSPKLKSISDNREEGLCKVRRMVPLWACQWWRDRHSVPTVSVKEASESTLFFSPSLSAPCPDSIQTVICSNLLADVLPPSWGLSHQSYSLMTSIIYRNTAKAPAQYRVCINVYLLDERIHVNG